MSKTKWEMEPVKALERRREDIQARGAAYNGEMVEDTFDYACELIVDKRKRGADPDSAIALEGCLKDVKAKVEELRREHRMPEGLMKDLDAANALVLYTAYEDRGAIYREMNSLLRDESDGITPLCTRIRVPNAPHSNDALACSLMCKYIRLSPAPQQPADDPTDHTCTARAPAPSRRATPVVPRLERRAE